MKKKVLIGCAAAVAVLAIVLFAIFSSKSPETSPPGPGSPASSQGGSDPEGEKQPESVSGIPDLSPTDDSYEYPFGEVDIDSLSKPTLSDAEVEEEIEDFLSKLLVLDPEAVDQVSPGTMMGEYNPFRLMLDVALADQTTGNAFRNMGSRTEYEILDISYSPDRTNFVIVTLSVTTPYLNAEAHVLAADSIAYYDQEYTKFKASGAAQALAGRSLNGVPLSTDVVELTFLVIDDEPIFYYPESWQYDDDEVPQYAFFWGGIIFTGTNGGDLLLENTYGSGSEVSESKFNQAELIGYLRTGLDYVRETNIDSLLAMSAGDNKMEQSLLPEVWEEMERLYKGSDGLEEEIKDRAASLEYEINTYLMKDDVGDFGMVAVTYSTVDPITDKRVYNTRTITVYNLKTALKSSGFSLNILISQVAEDCWNGGSSMAQHRMNILG